MKTVFNFAAFTLCTASLLASTAFADECMDLYGEAVQVDWACKNYETYLNQEIQKGHALLVAMQNLSYRSAREEQVLNDLQASYDNLVNQGPIELNKRCDKRWEVSAIYLGSCPKAELTCAKNVASQFDLKLSSPDKKGTRTMRTYDSQYRCLARKKKIVDQSKN